MSMGTLNSVSEARTGRTRRSKVSMYHQRLGQNFLLEKMLEDYKSKVKDNPLFNSNP